MEWQSGTPLSGEESIPSTSKTTTTIIMSQDASPQRGPVFDREALIAAGQRQRDRAMRAARRSNRIRSENEIVFSDIYIPDDLAYRPGANTSSPGTDSYAGQLCLFGQRHLSRFLTYPSVCSRDGAFARDGRASTVSGRFRLCLLEKKIFLAMASTTASSGRPLGSNSTGRTL